MVGVHWNSRDQMSSDKTTSFDASTELGAGGGGGETISSTKIQVSKSEPFREQHKRFVRTSRPSLQSLIIYIIVMYKTLAILWTLNYILFDVKNKTKWLSPLLIMKKVKC